MYTDDELFQVYLNGDQSAFDKLYERYSGPLFATVCRLIRDIHLAEDVTQEVFISVHNARHQYVLGTNFKAWLYRIARNAAITAAKRKDPVPESLLSESGSESAEFEASDVREAVNRVMLDMLPSYRNLIEMYYLEGMSVREMAGLLNIEEGATRRRLLTACNDFRTKACLKLGL